MISPWIFNVFTDKCIMNFVRDVLVGDVNVLFCAYDTMELNENPVLQQVWDKPYNAMRSMDLKINAVVFIRQDGGNLQVLR